MRPRGRAVTAGLLMLITVGAAVLGSEVAASKADSLAGSQGTDTAIPPTGSAVTVTGRDQYSNLTITVNQTAALTNQAVSITWTGGTPTVSGPNRFGAHYLQIMQCWGDDDGTVADNPGPPPEQCEQGALAGQYGGLPTSPYGGAFAITRLISRTDWSNYDPSVGYRDPSNTNVWMPFRAVDGTSVDVPSDPRFNPSVVGGNFWLNPYFNIITTNEIGGAATGADGKGAELFQVLTGVESAGLGCGDKTQVIEGGGKKTPQCWLVIVPRGDAMSENAGTPFGRTQEIAEQNGVVTSPLSPNVWKNRIAIPLDFLSVESPCNLSADSRRISGAELSLSAVASWQPALCLAAPTRSPYSFAPVGDDAARQQLLQGGDGAPGMALVSAPILGDAVTADNPVLYAPIAIGALGVGFNIERNPKDSAPPEAAALAGVRVATMNLTPRLVAKLLTQSYGAAVKIYSTPNYAWLAGNPNHLGRDPDFLRFNPEFTQLQQSDSRTFSSLQLPAGNADAFKHMWQWIISDPEAAAWLRGEPDQWGMKVNPAYSTDAATNTTGAAFGSPAPNGFPKADPYCYQAPDIGRGGSPITPPALCGTDWMPYQQDMAMTAQVTRSAFDGSKLAQNLYAVSPSDVWKKDIPQTLGVRDMLSLTTAAAAVKYGVQMASLSRAGDNGDNREFVAPTSAAMLKGIDSMRPTTGGVLVPQPLQTIAGAYPLTVISYAAVAPLSLDTAARKDFGDFVRYASTTGQKPGVSLGELPPGYAPLPTALRRVAAAVAGRIVSLRKPGSGGGGGYSPRPPSTDAPSVTDTAVATSDSTATTSPITERTESTDTTVPRRALSVSSSRFAIPIVLGVAMASGLGALEITKRPKRRERKRS